MNKKDIAKELFVVVDTVRYWGERYQRQLRKYIAEGDELSDNECSLLTETKEKFKLAIDDYLEFVKKDGDELWV